MNTYRMSRIADLLDSMIHDDGTAPAPLPGHTQTLFHLNYYIQSRDCGNNICCIAGLAALTFAPDEAKSLPIDEDSSPTPHAVRDLAARLLDLTELEADALFTPRNSFLATRADYNAVTPRRAAKVVREAVRRHRRHETFDDNIWKTSE